MVTDGPSHLSNNFIRVEKHIELNCLEEWVRMSIFRESVNKYQDESDLSIIIERPSHRDKKSPRMSIKPPVSAVKTSIIQLPKRKPLTSSKSQSKLVGKIPSHVISEYLRQGNTQLLKVPS